MPLAAQQDLEAVLGPRKLRELLSSAVDPGSLAEAQTQQRQARLGAALQAGDDLIRQFLDLDAIQGDAAAAATLRRLAVDEAIYYLYANSETRTSEDQDERARMRRADLAHMRKREQFPAKPVGQAAVSSGYVESTSPHARAGWKGFY